MIRRLLSFAAPYWTELVVAGLLGLVAVVCNIGLVTVGAYLIASAALKPLLLTLSLALYIVQAAGLGRSVARYAERLVSHSVTLRIIADVRIWLFNALLPLVPGTLLAFRSGDLLARLVKDLEELENVYVRGFSPLIIAGVIMVATVGILAAWHLSLGVTALLFLLLASCALPLLVAYLLRGSGERELAARAKLHMQMIDGIQGMADLQAYGAVPEFGVRLTATNVALETLHYRRAFVGGLQQGGLVLLAGLTTIVLLAMATPSVHSGSISGVYLGCLVLIVAGAFEAVGPIGAACQSISRARAAGTRLFEVAATPPVVIDPPHPQPLPARAALTFSHVSFTYAKDQPIVLDDIDLVVRPGSRIAVVGASGSGKSTLARLAVRAHDPSSGTVLYGEHSASSYKLPDLRSAITLVPQNPYIFTDTLRRNISMTRPMATDAEIWAAISTAQLEDVVSRLPDGLETWIGAEGSHLSGGERQRVALARALIARPHLLILDEATANLDTLIEHSILHNILGTMPSSAVLLITHRLVDLDKMDEIVVLDRGRIVERGNHAILVGRCGLYRAMLDTQNELLVSTPDHLFKDVNVMGQYSSLLKHDFRST